MSRLKIVFISITYQYKNRNTQPSMSEKSSIVDKLIIGDKEAKCQFFKSNYAAFMQIALCYVDTKTEASTIVNDSFMKIFKSVKRLDKKESLASWSASIVRNTTLDYVRKKVKYQRRHASIEEHQSITINDALQSLGIEEILKHIHSLNDKERIVFSMHAIDGYKHKEISEYLKISEGTSKWYLNQARKKLQNLLKKYTV